MAHFLGWRRRGARFGTVGSMAFEQPDPRSDQQLIAEANRGDGAAFEALYERYRDWAAGLALRFTGDRETALDVMQDAFLYLLSKFPGFVLTSQFKTFLYPVVKHQALAAKRKRRMASSADEVRPRNAGESAAKPEEAELAALRAALHSLDAEHREVLLLRFADDLSLQEIALAMQIPLGTVKSRLHHALTRLRDDGLLKKNSQNE